MAEESTAVGAEAARAALEASASITGGALSVSLKIDSPIVAGVALAAGAAVTLGAFYLRYRWKTENAIRNSLERMNAIGAADPEVINIEEGSIIVKLRCHTPQSVLQFVKDFNEKKVKRRLEEELKKIGFDKELEVTIVNGQEVFQREQELRSLLELQEDVKVTVEEVSLDPRSMEEREMSLEEREKKFEEREKRLKEREMSLEEREKKFEEEEEWLQERKKMWKVEEKSLQERKKRFTEREMSLEEREKKFEKRMNFHGMTVVRSEFKESSEVSFPGPSKLMKGPSKLIKGAWKAPEDPSRMRIGFPLGLSEFKESSEGPSKLIKGPSKLIKGAGKAPEDPSRMRIGFPLGLSGAGKAPEDPSKLMEEASEGQEEKRESQEEKRK